VKQNSTEKKLRGEQGFNEYYFQIFGNRWDALKKALAQEPQYAEWSAGGTESYFLDSGSVLAALSLPLSGAQKILDMCAAPGGKTLVIASMMEQNATLVSNERSPERKQRLSRVVASCLSQEVQGRVSVTCSDAAKLCLRQTETYDRILLDAPCSSERHVLADNKYLSEWSPSRIKTLAMEQWALLSSAWRLLMPGGYILYSTCALTPAENDLVVGRLAHKFPQALVQRIEPEMTLKTSEYVQFCKSALPSSEQTAYGRHVLPDTQNGAGPLYFSLIQKM
jgi:16S rRNA C967 or C1407 C5-methylase (RsmB/RsmF family)